MMLPGETFANDDAGINAVSCAGNWPPSGRLTITSSTTSRWSWIAVPVGRMPVTTARDLVPCRIRRNCAPVSSPLRTSIWSNAARAAHMSSAVTNRSSTSSDADPESNRPGMKSVAAVPTATKDQNPSNSAVDMPLGSACRPATEPNFYPVQMSAGAEVVTTPVVAHPRRAVIEKAWRAIGPGVEVLSGDDGGPLRRTVKRIIDPLVLRLRSNTQYSAPFVEADVAAAMHDAIVGHAQQLKAAAAWFEMLKRERRRQRITTGNAQELYFPVCFEMAVTKGAPAQADYEAAEAVLRDIHGDRDRTGIEVLNQYMTDPQVVTDLSL